MRFKFFVISVLLSVTFVGGCGNPVVPQPPNVVVNSVSQFYTPLSTALRYNYAHLDKRGAAYVDSSYFFTYQGLVDSNTIDGFGPVGGYFLGNASASTNQLLESYTYVSDSLVVEYGASCRSAANKIVLLKAPLDSGATWIAADNYLTPDGRSVRIVAVVEPHLESFKIGDVDYQNVFPVSYRVSGPDASDPHADFQNGSRHHIYFAANTGRIEEYAYDSKAKLLWTNEIRSITAR